MQDLRVPGGTTGAVHLLKIKVLETNLDIQRKFFLPKTKTPTKATRRQESPRREACMLVQPDRPTESVQFKPSPQRLPPLPLSGSRLNAGELPQLTFDPLFGTVGWRSATKAGRFLRI